MRLFVIFTLLLSLSSCKQFGYIWKPAANNIMKHSNKSNYNQLYRIAYDHGCESGMEAYGNDLYKAFYSFKRDRNLSKNKTYNRIWMDAFNYCRHYTSRHLSVNLNSYGTTGSKPETLLSYGVFNAQSLRNEPDTTDEWQPVAGMSFHGEGDWIGDEGRNFMPFDDKFFTGSTTMDNSFFTSGGGNGIEKMSKVKSFFDISGW